MRVSLNGSDWSYKDFIGDDWVWRHSVMPDTRDVRWWRTGTVPGSVHHDLWQNGEIPNPYYERNSLLIEWVPERTWVYKKTFRADPDWRGKRIRLVFEGIDYEAQVFLNGSRIGAHRGMFTPAVFEIGDALRYGEDNLLAVVLERAPDEQPQVGRTSKVRTHKSRMTYWWDFCPRMIHVGIWDEVALEITGPVAIEEPFVRPKLAADHAAAEVEVAAKLNATMDAIAEVAVRITLDGCEAAAAAERYKLVPGETAVRLQLSVPQPRLWWPNGSGEQPLYEAEIAVRLVPDGGADGSPSRAAGASGSQGDAGGIGGVADSDAKRIRFGIRTIELVRNETPDDTALPYTFVVNGRKLYIRGWNWVPVDVMYGVERPAKLNRLLQLAKRANVNMLRVWGGGLIEKESFYEACDRLGILVWQEFIQSSSGIENKPSEQPDFIAMMVDEAERIVPRKRNHPSLALWCGGNELQTVDERPLDDTEPVLGALRDAVRRLDPDRHWLATSPTGRLFSNSLSNIGADPDGLHDVHGPWEHQGLTEQYTLYNRGTSLMHSEFGVEGMTNRKALDATISRENQWPASKDNPVYFHRGAWWTNEPFVQSAFGGRIADIDTLIRASQLLQAEGLRYAVESNRRRKYRNSGSLPWQFNEPYPNGYCTSALDYYATPKPAYYAVARAYAPITVTASFAAQAWAGQESFEARLWANSSSVAPMAGMRLHAAAKDANGRIVHEASYGFELAANAPTLIGEIGFALDRLRTDLFVLDLLLVGPGGGELARNRYLFSRTADLEPVLRLPRAQVAATARRRGDEWTVELRNDGSVLAAGVRLDDVRSPEAEGYVYMSDNHFHLLPGESLSVEVQWDGVPERERGLEISGFHAVHAVVL
jgi:beta-mannosidase